MSLNKPRIIKYSDGAVNSKIESAMPKLHCYLKLDSKFCVPYMNSRL